MPQTIPPTVDAPWIQRTNLLGPFKPPSGPVTAEDWAKIAEGEPFETLPWGLVPAKQTQHAPPIMCYGVDIDPEVLLKYADDHGLAVYYDEVPLCHESEFDENGGFGMELFGGGNVGGAGLSGQDDGGSSGPHESTAVAGETASDGEDDDDIEGVVSVTKKLLAFFLSEDSEAEEDGPSIDRMASMLAALRAIGEEKGVHIPFVKIACGEQRSAFRETSLIVSFYTNYDIQIAEELPSKEEIEKMSESLGSIYPPGWYLDRNNDTWVFYAED